MPPRSTLRLPDGASRASYVGTPNTTPEPELAQRLTIAQVAELANCHPRTVRRAIAVGRLALTAWTAAAVVAPPSACVVWMSSAGSTGSLS